MRPPLARLLHMVSPSTAADLIGRTINLADERLGARALFATDDFFAPMARMLSPTEPEWRAGVYDENGKWMDGWESRRRRDQGHDYCIVQLAAPGKLALLDIDTRHFTGNYAPFASVEACRVMGAPTAETDWTELLPYSPLAGDRQNLFELQSAAVWSHLKLNIFPDGGVARLRAYGSVHRDWTRSGTAGTGTAGTGAAGRGAAGLGAAGLGASGPSGAGDIDLVAALNGGRALECSDEHYGRMRNLLLPGRGLSMGDGWETRRRREPGYDWVILALGHAGQIHAVEVDTGHFKGNFPHQISVNAALLSADEDDDLTSRCLYWPLLLEPQFLMADCVIEFRAELRDLGPISHVRVNLHPDGGLSRLRLFGQPVLLD